MQDEPSGGNDAFTGMAAIKVTPSTLTDAGRIKHTTPERGDVAIDRSFVIGDRLYTLSYLGLLSSNLTDLSAVKYTAF